MRTIKTLRGHQLKLDFSTAPSYRDVVKGRLAEINRKASAKVLRDLRAELAAQR